MNEVMVIESQIMDMIYYADQKMVKAVWKGFIKISEVEDIQHKMIDTVSKNGVIRFMSDTRLLKTIATDLQEHFFNVMLKLQDAGIARFAVIQSEEIFTQITVNKIVKKFNQEGKFELNVFTDTEKAENWLMQKTQSV